MKKITILSLMLFGTLGFSQSKDIQAPAKSVQLPAAYYNSTAPSIGETTGLATTSTIDVDVQIPFTGTYYSKSPNAVIYDNGAFFSVAGPPDISVLEDVSLGMGAFGFGAQFTSGRSIAEDLVLTADYDITSIDVFAYQTGSVAPSITAVYLQVWDGDPSGGGANVVWGDLTTNILDGATATDAFRQVESAPGDTARELQRVTANTAGLSLTAGTYWIDYSFEGSGASGPWAPPVVVTGSSTTGNALQNQAGVWVALNDVGPQGMPFIVYGDPVGGGAACDQEHPVTGDGNGGSGSSADSDFKTAADIVVAAGEDFTIDTIEVPFLTFAPEDAPVTASVVYYDDAAGLPGTILGGETVVPTILSSAEWVNPIAFIFETSLALTPFTFPGDASVDTKYWVEISMGTATNQATVFWLYTNTVPVEGEPMARFNAADGFWTIVDPTQEVVYSFQGECEPLSVADNTLGGFSYYPNPTTGLLSLKSVNNIETVSIFNLLGQKVMDANVGATTTDLNISSLKTGTYLMQVTVDGQTGTFKVLKN
ncbi:T9SS type A sorting domain-containing protein [Aequorivita sp. Q41]|uniref:T9SS type A sorting domain-containing protein n=1 Tax=Aequorivita sp. Q41 TaxID=3153300 RepID=UPI003242626A